MSRHRARCRSRLALAAAVSTVLGFNSIAPAATWQWDGGAGTGNWQTAANWNPDASNNDFNGTFDNRLNVNGTQELIYTSNEGNTTYARSSDRGLVVGSGSSGTMEITGGTFSTLGSSYQDIIGNGDNATGTLIINGGAYIGTNAGTYMGLGTGPGRVSIFNILSGSATVANLNLNSSSATINLDGGTLSVNNISQTAWSTGTLNLNGGTLRARQNNTAFVSGLSAVNVKSGGAIIDTNGFDVTIANQLLAGSPSGGLTKQGVGTLTLSGASNTYSGNTTVSAGTLNVTGSILNSPVQINGGTLQVSNGNALSNTGVVSLANAAGATFQVATSETIGALSGGGGTGGNVTIDAGQTLTLTSGTQTYSGTVSGSGALTNSGAVQTLNGAVSVANGISVTSGRLDLGSSSNSYTGLTTISAGAAVVVTANNALGATGSGNGVTITGTGGAVAGVLGLSGGITYAANEKVVGSGVGNTAAVSGLAAAQRGIVQSVSGNNTFAGDIEINSAGITRFGVQDGARLTLSGNITRSTGVTGVTVLFRGGTNDGDFITLSGSGNDWGTDDTLIYSSASTGFAGLRLGVNNALPATTTVLGATGAFAGTVLDLNGKNQALNGLRTQSGDAPMRIVNLDTANASVLTLANTADRLTDKIGITNDGGGVIHVVKTGSFTQGLGATNSYTGTTSIQGGRLDFRTQVALYNNTPSSWTAANIIIDSGAMLGLSVGGTGEFTAADVSTIATNLTSSISNNGLKAGSFLGLQVNSATTVSAVLTDSTGTGGGAVGLVKTGTASLTLNQNNSYSGGTLLNDGYLNPAHNSALGTGTLTIGAGAERLAIVNGINIANDIVINGGGTSFNGLIQNFNAAAGENVTVSGNITINAATSAGGHFASQGAGSTLTVAGPITSASATVSTRTGTVIFSGGGSYPSLSITGTARLGADNGLATNATATIGASNDGVLDLAGKNQSLVGIVKSNYGATIGSSSTTSDSTLTITGTSTYAGVIRDTVGSGTRKVNLVMNGSGQTLTLTAANTYTGTTTITAGTLKLDGAGSINHSATIDVQTGGTLDVTTKTGGFTVGATQTIKGNGTVSGGMTVAGTVAPGASVGTLTTTTFTLNAGSTFAVEVDETSADKLVTTETTAAPTLGGTLLVIQVGNPATLNSVHVIIDQPSTAPAVTTAFSTLAALNAITYTVDYAHGVDGNDVAITITGVPEPASLSLLALGALALRRRGR